MVNPPVPLMGAGVGGYWLRYPLLRVPAPSVTLPPVAPPPASEPIVSFVPLRSSVAPATFASVTAEVSAMAKPPATCSVPALIAVAPV